MEQKNKDFASADESWQETYSFRKMECGMGLLTHSCILSGIEQVYLTGMNLMGPFWRTMTFWDIN